MDARVLRTLVLAAAFAVSIVSGSPAAAQSCGCSHQGGSVDCPDNLPPGSRSVQYVSGGTMWVTPTNQQVFVPHTSFVCTSPATSVQQSKTHSVQQPVAPQTGSEKSSSERSNILLDRLIRGRWSRHDKIRRDTSSPVMQHDCQGYSCAGRLQEDPAMVCYRNVSATVTDGNGMTHGDSLYVQLGQAAGIAYAQIQTPGTCATCNQPAYDCSGTFYDRDGKPMKVPGLPTSVRSDADITNWKANVQLFYLDAYVEPHGRRLSPGKAALCTEWAGVSFQAKPDPSLLQALDTLQQIGAESAYRQDRKWQTAIFAAGTAKGCPVPVLPPQHDIESWFVPESSARSFHKGFRDCAQPDTNGVGGCPHAFDAPTGKGNFVNDRHLLDADTMPGASAAFFVGDESSPCGAECYRQTDKPRDDTGQRSPAPRDRLVSTHLSSDADAECTAAVNQCIDACQSSNAAISRMCIELRGSPIGGVCTANVDRCSCSQTAPECKR